MQKMQQANRIMPSSKIFSWW